MISSPLLKGFLHLLSSRPSIFIGFEVILNKRLNYLGVMLKITKAQTTATLIAIIAKTIRMM